jgi:subtilase family serine protease
MAHSAKSLRVSITALLGLALTVLLLAPGALAADSTVGKQVVKGILRPEFSQAPMVGRMDDNAVVHLAIGLPLTNKEQLDTALQQAYDPKSPNFHHFLTPEEFAQQYGGNAADYKALVAFVQAQGLTVTAQFPHRLVLAVSGTAAAVNKAFHVTLSTRKRADGTAFFAPDRDPSIDVDAKVLYISGLDNFIVSKPSRWTGSAESGLFGGLDFRNSYAPGVTLTGKGQSLGLFELDGYYPSDIPGYRSQFPDEFTGAAITNTTQVSVASALDGFVSTSQQSGPPTGGCNGNDGVAAGVPRGSEPTFDIDVAIAMAPGLDHVYAYEGCNGDDVLGAMASKTADGVLPKQLSASWTLPYDPTSIQLFSTMAMLGQSFFFAVGDGDATCPNGQTSAPQALPYVTQVGGTVLLMNQNPGSWQAETAASDGGGILNGVPMPSYQQNAAAQWQPNAARPWRMVPDVSITSCDGSSQCGIYNYFTENLTSKGPGHGGDGTSASSPLWAAYTALVNERRAQVGLGSLGFLNPAIYAIAANPVQYAADFHDITEGASKPNTSPSCVNPVGNSAAVGYDMATGLGSPTANLINDLAPAPPPAPVCTATLFCDVESVKCTGTDVAIYGTGDGVGQGAISSGHNGSSTASLGGLFPPVSACSWSGNLSTCITVALPTNICPSGNQVNNRCGEGSTNVWCQKFQECLPAAEAATFHCLAGLPTP